MDHSRRESLGLLLDSLILSSIILMEIYVYPNNVHIQSQRFPPLSLVKKRHSYKWTRGAIDRQTDGQTDRTGSFYQITRLRDSR